MEKLSPEDISRAREWREKSGIGRFHHTAECHISKEHPHGTDYISAEEYAAAYSAAENERLTKERGDAVNAMQVWEATAQQCGLAHAAAEAKCDRLKAALEKLVSIIPYQHCSTCNRFATEIQAALRPEGE